MKKAIVKSGQTLWDIAVEHCGSADNAFELARLNGLTPTLQPPTGTVLKVPEPTIAKIVGYYAGRAIVPASVIGGGCFSHVWGNPLCEQEETYHGFLWADPECVQDDPYAFVWSGTVCVQEEGPFRFQWTAPECVATSTAYGYGWSGPVCTKEEPYAFVWGNGHCVLIDGPYGFIWQDAVCSLAEGPYTFVWSDSVCAQYYDDSLEWEEIQ
jgi:hypothetical protein